jgi:predicted nucleotidyltransferase
VATRSAKTAAQVARAVADALERRKIPYAIGGALALGFYAPPRATVDVDVNIFVAGERGFTKALGVLNNSGFVAEADPVQQLRQAREEGQFRGRIEDIRVDVFVSTVPFYKELRRRVRNAVLLGRPIKILAAEDLVVLKLMFFRRKDLADAEAVIRDQGTALDRRKVRARLVKLVGEEDERVRVWDELASER